MSVPTPCSSCRSIMHAQVLPGHHGDNVELDLCFQCQGLWIDPKENLKLTPAAVADLFKVLYDQRHAGHHPLAAKLNCPRCTEPLSQGFDMVRSGRYLTYRCAQGHGRFSAFSSFMIEKGFVRQLTRPEIDDIAKRVAVIHCSSCGAPVDLRKDHACQHCRSALSLLDPHAVERALQGYARAANKAASADRLPADRATGMADALIMLERDRLRAQKVSGTGRSNGLLSNESDDVDLWSIGLTLVAAALS